MLTEVYAVCPFSEQYISSTDNLPAMPTASSLSQKTDSIKPNITPNTQLAVKSSLNQSVLLLSYTAEPYFGSLPSHSLVFRNILVHRNRKSILLFHYQQVFRHKSLVHAKSKYLEKVSPTKNTPPQVCLTSLKIPTKEEQEENHHVRLLHLTEPFQILLLITFQ